jgi:hypothetical protein
MEKDPKPRVEQAMSTFSETFGLNRMAAISVVVFAGVVILAGLFWFIRSAPPRTLTITSGPPGSSFQRFAERYRDILSSNGVTLKILPSGGSIENLRRLSDPSAQVDIGFIQAGESAAGDGVPLFSLGTIAYQPLLIFYRGDTAMSQLAEFAGKRLAIGPEGSGTRKLALTLLATNGITEGGKTTLTDLDPESAAKALLAGNVDAVFLMGDSASVQTMRLMIQSTDVRVFDFIEADAYARRFSYLDKLILPRGVFDLARDIPARDINLVGPTVELIARTTLHPALSDLLLEAAREVHGKASLLQDQGEFPAPQEHDFKISPDATRYYKSGKSLLYRSLPFWLASLINRTLVAFVPMILVLIPGLKYIPAAYKWRTQLSIYRWYRSLLRVERDLSDQMTDRKRAELRKRMDQIEQSVYQMKVPASFAGQFYGLREHIRFVRGRLGPD